MPHPIQSPASVGHFLRGFWRSICRSRAPVSTRSRHSRTSAMSSCSVFPCTLRSSCQARISTGSNDFGRFSMPRGLPAGLPLVPFTKRPRAAWAGRCGPAGRAALTCGAPFSGSLSIVCSLRTEYRLPCRRTYRRSVSASAGARWARCAARRTKGSSSSDWTDLLEARCRAGIRP